MVGRFVSVCFVLLAAAAVFGQSSSVLGESEGTITLAWEDSAATYRVEVRREGQVFIDIKQAESELKLDLAPGPYEYRISVIDPFGDILAVSEWQNLTVERPLAPYFRVRKPLTVWEGESHIEIEIESVRIDADTDFHLVKNGVRHPVRRSDDSTEFIISVDGMLLEQGSWDLEARNRSGRTFVYSDAVVVQSGRTPRYTHVSRNRMRNTGLIALKVFGNFFDPEMEVHLRGPGEEVPVELITVIDAKTAQVYLDMARVAPGEYGLVLTNPSGASFHKAGVLTVIQVREHVPHPDVAFHLGYTPMVIFPPDRELTPSFVAVEAALLIHSGWTAPFARGLGVEIRGFTGFTGPWMDALEIYAFGGFDFSAYWRPILKGRSAPVVILGFGSLRSEQAVKSGMESLPYLRVALGLDISSVQRISRIGISLQFAFADSNIIPMVSLMYRGGTRVGSL